MKSDRSLGILRDASTNATHKKGPFRGPIRGAAGRIDRTGLGGQKGRQGSMVPVTFSVHRPSQSEWFTGPAARPGADRGACRV